MKITIENGKIEYGGNTLIENINFEVNENSKIAIIGKNGSGKTSLLKVITGQLSLTFDSSNLNGYMNKSGDFSIGYLKQISLDNDNRTLEEEILLSYKSITDLYTKLEKLEELLAKDSSEKNIIEYSKAQELYENMGGYYYQKEYRNILKKFGFTTLDLQKPIKEFSGGEKTKIAFIKLLLSKPDLLILDEPTNHLDIEAIEWLEEYLKSYKKAFIVVSHDREFMNKVVTTIYEIEYNTITKYSGNYNDYLKQKEINYKSLEKRYNEQQKKIQQEQELIDRFRYKATKAKMVQSRIKQLDKMDIIQLPKKTDSKTFKMNINPYSESGKEVLNIKDLTIGYTHPIATINLKMYKGDKIAIIGGNGSGKSTLLKTLIGKIKPLSGEFIYGFNVQKGYFDQESATIVNDKSVLEDYQNMYPFLTNQEARNDLGAFLFSGNDVDKKVSVLSGGEVVRLALVKLFKQRPNFLILDEPTNHMDIYSKERIEEMLKSYKGSVLLVSHDRYLVRKIADSVLYINGDEVKYFPYGYEQYLNKKDEVIEEPLNLEVKKNIKESFDSSNIKKEIAKIEKEIKEHEKKIEKINMEFEKEEVYTDFLLCRELEEEMENLEDNLSILMNNWEKLIERLEEK